MFGTQEQTSNGPWLVKSGDRVLGPYTTEEVGRLLRAKEIVVIDEVISPQARWAYVRDVSAFNSVVDEIRRGQAQSREDTEIQGYTNTVIPPVTNPLAQEPTPVTGANVGASTGANVNPNTITHINDMPDHTITEIGKGKGKAPGSASPSAPTPPPQSSGASPLRPTAPVTPNFNQAPSAPKKPELKPLTVETPTEQSFVIRPHRRRAPGLVVGGLVLLLAAGFVVFTVSKKTGGVAPAAVVSTENLETQASVAWKRGEFDRALELYRAIDRQQPKQPAVVARLALLMMQLEGQTVEAKRSLQTVSDKVTDMEAGSQIQIALGLASLHNEDGRDAVTRFTAAGSSWIAAFDRGVAHASLKEWPEAVRAFQEANDQPIALYMLARAQMSAADAGSKPALRKDAETTIARGLAKFADYKQELLVLGAYADLISGNRKRAEARALQAVETDPDQTPEHFHDPALSVDAASWANLVPMCREIQTS
ncbi:MAG: tetratricopeptide repeat protein, partial [Proteobacteria bacterium]